MRKSSNTTKSYNIFKTIFVLSRDISQYNLILFYVDVWQIDTSLTIKIP